MEDDEKKENAKRVYEKPLLRSIDLVAEEVLATGCKTKGSSAVGKPTCHSRPCSVLGS